MRKASGALLAVAGVLWLGAFAAPRGDHAAERDILSVAELSPSEVRVLVRNQRFEAAGPLTDLHSRDGSRLTAVVVSAAEERKGDSQALAAGAFVARIDAEGAAAPYGLSSGANYLWIDRLGSADAPWRAVMVSADGRQRTLLGTVKYTAAGSHAEGLSVARHSTEFCDGKRACVVPRSAREGTDAVDIAGGFDHYWVGCAAGCCYVAIRAVD